MLFHLHDVNFPEIFYSGALAGNPFDIDREALAKGSNYVIRDTFHIDREGRLWFNRHSMMWQVQS